MLHLQKKKNIIYQARSHLTLLPHPARSRCMAPPWVPQFWDHPTRLPCTVRRAPHGADIFASEHLVVGRKQLLEKTSANPKDGLIICTLKPLDRKKTWSCWKTKKNKWTTINHKKINLHRQISLHFTDFFLAFLQAQHLSSDPIGSSTSLAAAARWGPRVELQLRPLPTRRSWKPRSRWRPGNWLRKKVET